MNFPVLSIITFTPIVAAVIMLLLPAQRKNETVRRREGVEHFPHRFDALDDDVRTIGATYGWMGRQGARITWRTAQTVGHVSSRLGRSLVARVRREV